jgi:Ca2+-transporting ATPase
MILLLLLAAGFYFSSGQWPDGLFLSISVIVVGSISLVQELKSRTALERLKAASVPKAKAIRDGVIKILPAEELLKGDAVVVEEGNLLPADGIILHANDFSVNESVLTGESLPVSKSQHSTDPLVYQGCTVASGLAIIEVTSTGSATRLSAIEKTIHTIQSEKTPLEIQINSFVKYMAVAGMAAFSFVWLLNYLHSQDWKDSLLKALTLAMSVLPEEIPVAFSTFMAIGAWKLMKMGVLVKNLKTVEALGSATVICVDKTGTITQNKMSLASIWSAATRRIRTTNEPFSAEEVALIETAMWASEPIPFDPMEKAIHEAYSRYANHDERAAFQLVHEYPLSGRPPMMTHIFEGNDGRRVVACKGAAEAILKVSGISADADVEKVIQQISAQGYRVLAVAEALLCSGDFPKSQQEIKFTFKGQW